MDQAQRDWIQRDQAVKAAAEAFWARRTVTDDKGRKRPRAYAEIRPLWQALWEACDFSWEGLADAAWERGDKANNAQEAKRWRAPADFPLEVALEGAGEEAFKPASLRDYWRWVPAEGWSEDKGWTGGRLASDEELKALGLVVETDGRLWHVLHRPEARASVALDKVGGGADVQSGAAETAAQMGPEPKATAAALRAAILQRLALARPGFRAAFTGARATGLAAVWRDFAGTSETKRPLHVAAVLAAFDRVDVSGLTFGDGAGFESATFGGWANFKSATFGDGASFASATFGDGADFESATFGDGVGFESATFGGWVGFQSATFGNEASFWSATFGDGASFESATFGDGVGFGSATFGGCANFRAATFGDGASFRSATFGDGAGFESATFGDGARFWSATFGDGADFRGATFGVGVGFESATFGDRASFDSATFAGNLKATKMVCRGRFQMRAAEVKAYADFSGAQWPERFEEQHAAFEGCRFRDVADFKTPDFSAFGLFDGAEFKGRVLLLDPGDRDADALFLVARRAAQAAVKADKQAFRDHANAVREHKEALRQWQASEADKPEDERAKAPDPPELEYLDERGANARFGALAGGLRTLKLAMVAQSDVDREQRFYRYELKARAFRPSEPQAAKFAASVYGLAADYGASIGRPFIALAFVLVSFAAAYWSIGLGLGLVSLPPTPGPIYQSLEFSLTNTFRPLSALTAEGFREATLGKRLLEHSDLIALVVRLFSILQSLIALILAFLFGLAVRRRFQIA
jgi:hypothetical protein